MKQILITPSELADLISRQVRLALHEHELSRSLETTEDQLLTRVEAAKLLKCSLVSLRKYTCEGKLKQKNLGRKVYYLKSDIMDYLNRSAQ